MEAKSFPYKTLIWALVALIALYLFKNEIIHLLYNSTEIEIFGIRFKASDDQVVELKAAQADFIEQEEALKKRILEQEVAMDSLNLLAANLSGQIQGCQSAQSTATKIDSSLNKLKDINRTLKSEPFLMKSQPIIKFNSNGE